MQIVNARWTQAVNMLTIECGCGTQFEHRADRWHVSCPSCHRRDHLENIRERMLTERPAQSYRADPAREFRTMSDSLRRKAIATLRT